MHSLLLSMLLTRELHMTKSLDHIDNCIVGFFLGQLFRKGLIYFCWGSKKLSNLKLEQNALLQEISLLIEYHQTLLIDAHSLISLHY